MTKLDDVIHQLNSHQEALSSIQNTQARHSSMLKALHTDRIEIKAALQDLTKSVADLNRKLDARPPFYHLPPENLNSTPPSAAIAAAPLGTSSVMNSTVVSPPSPKSNNQHLQPNQAELQIGDSDLKGEKKQPLFGAGLNRPPSLFWGPAASQPPFAGTTELQASFARAKAHNMFEKMHRRNWATDEATLNGNTKVFADLDSPKRPDLELLVDNEISYHTLVGAIGLKVMQLATPIRNQPTLALVSSVYATLILLDLFELKTKTDESKVFIFDPGGISHVQQHI